MRWRWLFCVRACLTRAPRYALQREGGWLTVTGLFWLHKGANSFGTDAGGDIVLADGAAHAGTIELHSGKVTVKMDGATRELELDWRMRRKWDA